MSGFDLDRAHREGIVAGIPVTPANGQALCAALEGLRAVQPKASTGQLLEMVLMAGVSFLQLRVEDDAARRETLIYHSADGPTQPDDNERVLLQVRDDFGECEVRAGYREAGDWWIDYGLGRSARLARGVAQRWAPWPEGVRI